MIYRWNQSFEAYPPGSYRGNTMGEALRRMKAAFYERFIVEHEITEGSNPTVLHRLGECSVIKILDSDDTPSSEYVEGGLQYKQPGLYWDSGSELYPAVIADHGNYTGLDDDDHPQYVKVSGGSLDVNAIVGSVTGLSTRPEDYSSAYPSRVLSVSGHLGTDDDGLSYHEFEYTRADIVNASDHSLLRLSGSKWNKESLYIGDADGLCHVLVKGVVSMPMVSNVSGTGRTYFFGRPVYASSSYWNSYMLYHAENDPFSGDLNIEKIAYD